MSFDYLEDETFLMLLEYTDDAGESHWLDPELLEGEGEYGATQIAEQRIKEQGISSKNRYMISQCLLYRVTEDCSINMEDKNKKLLKELEKKDENLKRERAKKRVQDLLKKYPGLLEK